MIYAADGSLRDTPLDVLDPAQMPWARREEAQSDEAGRFAIRVDAQATARLAVRAAGFAPHDSDVVIAGLEKDVGDIVLEDSAVLAGRVVDSAGRAVAGAELHRVDETDGRMVFFGNSRGAVLAKSDAQGRFKIDQLASGPWKLVITSENHPDTTENGETEHPGSVVSNLEFVLEDGSDIAGRVVDVPAEMLANLWIRATPRPSTATGDASDPGSTLQINGGGIFSAARRAKCNSDGTFEIRGLKKSATYRVSGREGEREFFGRTRTDSVTAHAGDRGLRLVFKPETAIVFQVVDAQTSEPITTMTVSAGYRYPMPLLDENSQPVRHFPGGRVRYGNFPPKPEDQGAELRIESVGYRLFELKDLQLVEGQDQDFGVLRLERAPVVKVFVQDDATGQPIAGALVSLVEQESEPKGNVRMIITSGEDDDSIDTGNANHARTAEDGRATLTSLPGKRAKLDVRSHHYGRFTSEPMLLPLVDDLEQVVRLRAGGSVTVRVVDSKGVPLAGASVEHKRPNAGDALMLGGDANNVTNTDGEVVFEHLEAGLHRFKLADKERGGFAIGGITDRRVRRVSSGLDREAGWSEIAVGERDELVLEIVAPARSALSGKISEGGKALANATVRLVDKSDEGPALPFFGGGNQVRTNSKGEYKLDDVKVGEYRVFVAHASRAMDFETEVHVREGDNEKDLDLPIAVIEGRITGSDKKPIAGVRVRAERASKAGKTSHVMATSVMFTTDGSGGDGPEVSFSTGDPSGQTVFTDSDGRYKLRGVQPDVDLVVKASGKDVQPKESAVLHVAADETKSGVDLALEQGGAIDVTIVRADGRLGTACLVHGRFEGESASSVEPKTEFTGSGGSVKLSGLKPGKWRLSVDALGAPASDDRPAVPEQEIEVNAGETKKAQFELP